MNNRTVCDLGVSIDFTTLEISEELKDKTLIESTFKEYKERILKKTNFKKNSIAFDEFDKYLYNPKFFYLFGKFDLAAITLVDDFDFPTRNFTPKSSKFSKKEDSTNVSSSFFHRKVLLGPISKLNSGFNIKDYYEKLISPINKFPLISITQLKLNDLHLGEISGDYLLLLLQKICNGLNRKITSISIDNPSLGFDFLISESYSWNEINLVLFSSSFKTNFEILLEIRELTRKDLEEN